MPLNMLATELRMLFESAHRYLAGESSVHELNGRVSQCIDFAGREQAEPAIVNLLVKWQHMINKRWNEWGLEREPLTKEQFIAWLEDQLILDGKSANLLFQRTADGGR
jgi:hypothetical protein